MTSWLADDPPDGTRVTTTAADVATVLRSYRFSFGDEYALQGGVAAAIAAAGLPTEREVRLSGADRLDVMAGGVAVEVKVAGTADRVLAQLRRYAAHERVTSLVLVTTRARHCSLPVVVGGKPLAIVYLGGAA